MKIVQVNKFYFPEYGTEKYLFNLMAELKKRGHEIIPFSMQHPKNQKTPYAKYFVSNVDLSHLDFSWHGLKAYLRMLYSLEARKKFAKLLDDTKPDLVHIHSIHHQISPSILREAKKRGIPVVQTLHDYKLVCPSYLFPLREGKLCTNCRNGKWLHVILHKAHKDSYLSTALVVFESLVHKITRIYERNVDKFIVPSLDMAKRLVRLGVRQNRLKIIPHFINLDFYKPGFKLGKGIFFAGRLMPDRGLDQILLIAQAFPNETIYIAGEGSEQTTLQAKIKLQNINNIKLLGRLNNQQMVEVYQESRLVFFPSLTLDTFGLTVLEAMACAKPVVATRLGALVDLVSEEQTGFLYDPKHPEQAVEQIKKILSDDALARNLGQNARKQAENYSIDAHYDLLQNTYRKVLIDKQQKEIENLFAHELIWER